MNSSYPQTEAQLEEQLIKQLSDELKYQLVFINDENDLLNNLKEQLGLHNNTVFSDGEFKRIKEHLKGGNIFKKAKKLRDHYDLKRDDDTVFYVEFLNQSDWCQNQFQVTSQVTIVGRHENRYDVTLLINGLPLVQIELKKRGIELKEAFNQIERYSLHSFGYNSELYNYVQIFVISNGVNTKYYSNNKERSFEFTFYWAKKDNSTIDNLHDFTAAFLTPCFISKMISRYIVFKETENKLMILRPYQYYAVEDIVALIKDEKSNGYIWHTTGSGKTLTSFKVSQILSNMHMVKKVIFVVDRKDLDSQTAREFNEFSDGSIDGTDNTKILVDQFCDRYKTSKGELKKTDLIITTIQKLNTAISKEKYKKDMEILRNENIVFIFDECHRSQFGETHKKIIDFFLKARLIGFTGTPIFPENAASNQMGKRTTADLFGKSLHRYLLPDAIADKNVLRFSIEYINTFKEREHITDATVQSIDINEAYEKEDRLEKIVDFILNNHDRKTQSQRYNSIFAVQNVNTLIKYYDIFKRKNKKLKIVTIFSYGANDEVIYGSDEGDEEDKENQMQGYHNKDKLFEYVSDFNAIYNTKHSLNDTRGFYAYYNDVSDKIKKNDADILLVVNMFLTGFDSPKTNTFYVDKNLKYHGLIQAFSRTNRVEKKTKSQGNIVSFRNLKDDTDRAIALFSNKNAQDIVLLDTYDTYVNEFNNKALELLKIVGEPSLVNNRMEPNDKLEFVKLFRDLIRILNILKGFSEFKWNDLVLSEQVFNDFSSKYYDIKNERDNDKSEGKVSILDDIDFELELIRVDDITLQYILELLTNLFKNEHNDDNEKNKQAIENAFNASPHLKSKEELIRKFMEQNLKGLDKKASVEEEFNNFFEKEKEDAFSNLCIELGLNQGKTKEIIDNMLYEDRDPTNKIVIDSFIEEPDLFDLDIIVPKTIQKFKGFISKFFI